MKLGHGWAELPGSGVAMNRRAQDGDSCGGGGLWDRALSGMGRTSTYMDVTPRRTGTLTNLSPLLGAKSPAALCSRPYTDCRRQKARLLPATPNLPFDSSVDPQASKRRLGRMCLG